MRRALPQGEEPRFAPPPLPIGPPRPRTQRAKGSPRQMPHRGTEARRSSDKEISTEQAALLWLYCREVAPFETPSFGKKIGQLIAHATNTPAALYKPSTDCHRGTTAARCQPPQLRHS